MGEANRCRNARLPADEAVRLLAANLNRPPRPANEITRTVAKAYSTSWAPSPRPALFGPRHRAPVPLKALEFNPDKLAAVASEIEHPLNWRHWLWARSLKRPESQNAYSFLAHLYRPGETVLAFDDMESKTAVASVAVAQPMDCRVPDSMRAGGEHGLGVWFLCNPVDGLWHPNPRNENKPSCRSEESLTAFRYAVLESDQAPFDDWLAFVAQLPLRIAAIYTSGGRSIHALIRLDAANKAQFDATLEPLKRPLKVLGADIACLSGVRLTRLPGCWRPEKRGFQRLLYLNPNPPDVRLADLPVIRSRSESLARWRTICPRWNPNQAANL